MTIVFIQTADSGPYFELLTTTSRTVRAYCDRHGFAYEAFVGVKRGCFPWHAAFNRIYLLDEAAAAGRHDWAVYMDADAYVADQRFDLARYLGRKSRFAAVLSPSGATHERWDVNDGVVMLNLRHPFTRKLLGAWRAAYEAIPDATLREQPTWSNPDDQEMLQAFLRDDPDASRFVHLAPRKLFNSAHARVIQQMVRAFFPDFASRLRMIRSRVDEVLGDDEARDLAAAKAAAEEFVGKLYLAVLRRNVDPAGLAHFTPLVQHLGYEAGARRCLNDMLGSEEYRTAVLAPQPHLLVGSA